MDKPWKLILLLVGIFAAGSVTGGFISLRLAKRAIERRPPPEQWATRRLKQLEDRLNLSAEQKDRLAPIIRRDVEDLGRIRNSAMSDTRRILERMERDISEMLTP